MTRSIIFVGGIHGVGKTYLCKSLEESLSFKHYSASQLIKSLKDGQSVSIDKRVANIDGNQQLLLTAISEYIKPDVTAVLDGHFCLLNNKKKIEYIPVEIFSCISPISIIVLHDSIKNIGNKISGRDGVRYNYELLTTFQEKEIEYSQYIAQHLHIPYLVFDVADDIAEVEDFILRQTGRKEL